MHHHCVNINQIEVNLFLSRNFELKQVDVFRWTVYKAIMQLYTRQCAQAHNRISVMKK